MLPVHHLRSRPARVLTSRPVSHDMDKVACAASGIPTRLPHRECPTFVSASPTARVPVGDCGVLGTAVSCEIVGALRIRSLLILSVLFCSCAYGASSTGSTVNTSAVRATPPPAATGIDNTVSVTLLLADSFDALPNGKCAGRSSNAGIADGAPVQLRGDTAGGSVWSTATADYQYFPPQPHDGRPQLDEDDGRYCIVKAVFAPTQPDEHSRYSIKFSGGNWRGLVTVGKAPYGQLDRPGYGSTFITIQTCRSASDPPDKVCPEVAS
jgi:hypothetical protein